jgi:hypothetical protein
VDPHLNTRDLLEVGIQTSQNCLVSNNADALVLTLNFDDDGLEALDDIHV